MLRKTLLRIGLIFLLVLLCFAGNSLFDSLERELSKPVALDFTLPLPKEIVERYGITKELKIRKVTVTGTFADWKPDREDYRLQQQSPSRWTIRIRFKPGRNRYKFVVHTRDQYYDSKDREWRRQIWTHDKNAPHLESDSFGGNNSLIVIHTVRHYTFVFNLLVWGLIAVVGLLIVLEPITRWVMARRLPFRAKLVVGMLMIGLISNISFIIYNFMEQRSLVKEGFIQAINVLHAHVLTNGVDFARLNQEKQRDVLRTSINNLLEGSTTRSEKQRYSNRQFNFIQVAVCDTNFQLIVLGRRQESDKNDVPLAKKFGFRSVKEYFQKGVLQPVIRQARLRPQRDTVPFFGRQNVNLIRRSDKHLIPFLGFDCMIYPVRQQGRHVGYYCVTLHVGLLFGQELRKILLFNGYMLLISALLFFLLLRGVGRQVTGQLSSLVEGIQAVKKGNLDMPITITTRDEFQQLGDAYNFMREGLKETARLKKEFLANTSHELRTPLNGIMGLVESILDGADGPVSQPVARHLGMIRESTHNLKQMVDSILEMSRLESATDQFHPEPVRLGHVLDQVRPIVAGLEKSKQIEVRFPRQHLDTLIFVDTNSIRQVMINLIGNAFKFTEQGSVVISATPERGKQGFLRISVRDTGIGINPGDKETIFEPFRQADGSDTRRYEGSGLGLAIARRIVERHTGRIWVESEPGKGSCFNFTLPLYDEAQPPILTPTPVPHSELPAPVDPKKAPPEPEDDISLPHFPEGKGENLLLVDDMPLNLEALATRLAARGYHVSKALSADEALNKLESGKYDLVISDVMMPEMDGYELTRRIKSDPRHMHMQVILLTAKTRLEDKRLGFQAGADDYVVKPFELGELLLRIRHAIDARRLPSDLTIRTDEPYYETNRDERFGRLSRGNGELILVVDDNPVNLEAIRTRLEMNNWRVETAGDGLEGLRRYRELRPALVLLDVMMPEIDGYRLCQRIREEHRDELVPIIFLTARQELTDKIYGINVGGDDYITKPFDKDDLVIRISHHLRTRTLMQEIRSKQLLERDMEVAGLIQRRLFPSSFPRYGRLQVYGNTQQAQGVGGDYFDVIPTADQKLLLVIADVMGKGMSAALVMVKIQTLLNALVREGRTHPEDLAGELHQALLQDLDGNRFVSACIALIDPQNGQVSYLNAGHQSGLLFRNEEQRIVELEATVEAIGLWRENTGSAASETVLQSGDTLLLYTDGINEARDRTQQTFGEERLHRLLRENNAQEPVVLFKAVMDAVAAYTADSELRDDMSLLVARME